MKKLHAFLFASVLLLSGSARADAVADCESAYHYGANTASWFVATVFNKVVRGRTTLAQAHTALDVMLTTYSQKPLYESEELEHCHLRGLWEGFVTRLAVDYARAGGAGEFSCIDRLALAAHARAMLGAMASWMDLSTPHDEVVALFATERGGEGVPWCEPRPRDECAAVLAADAYAPLVEPVAVLLCEDPAEPSADAGTDAGVDPGADAGPD